MFALWLWRRLKAHRQERRDELADIARTLHESERTEDGPEKSMSDTVFETYDKFPDGGPV